MGPNRSLLQRDSSGVVSGSPYGKREGTGASRLSPLGLGRSLALFLVPAAILYMTHYYLVPAYVQRTGYPYLAGYLLGWGGTMGLFFVAALVAYRWEGNPGTWRAFAARYRLRKLRGKDWLWTGAALLVIALTLFGLDFTTEWLASMPLFAPHQDFPPELGPSATSKLIPGEFMGMALKGQWWVPAVFLLGWFLNVFGEEFWFRGYLLPRQEPAFGSLAWLANALMFTFTHVWQPWNLLTILPGALFGVYVAQRRQNTWILIIVHGILNISLFFVLLGGVLV